MLESALQFLVMKGACRGCGRDVPAFRRACPECRLPYPTARPVFYWSYLVLAALAIPSIALFVLWYHLGIKI